MLSILLSLLNWGFGVFFSGLLVREIARRPHLRLADRATGAAPISALAAASCSGSPRPRPSATPVQVRIHLPVVLLLAVALMATFTYHPPVLP